MQVKQTEGPHAKLFFRSASPIVGFSFFFVIIEEQMNTNKRVIISLLQTSSFVNYAKGDRLYYVDYT